MQTDNRNVRVMAKRFGVKRAAEILQCNERKVYRLVEEDDLPHYKIGGSLEFTEDQLFAYLRACERPGILRSRTPAAVLNAA